MAPHSQSTALGILDQPHAAKARDSLTPSGLEA